jgi:predicted nucleic acid-binding protein
VKLTFIDSGVLIAATRGDPATARAMLEVLDGGSRTFASSILVRLEPIPKAAFSRNRDKERTFYDRFFATVSKWARIDDELMHVAFDEACKAGLSAMDSLHVACAYQLGCDELVTTEKINKPIRRNGLVRVLAI